jgi:adenosylcobyric acid synthase
MAARKIMVQGTMSNSGKSFLVAALCRIFHQDGFKTAPFKSQNMALNSYITKDGLEIGRAQAMQAEAAGIDPTVDMNPILLKPTSQMGSQVIVNGEVMGNMRAMDYYRRKTELIPLVREAFSRLEEEYDVIVLEGAGSPAEINLRDNDIVNMGMAKIADAPVILVGDIDRGGVFASLYGTVELLEPEERARIKGLVINKFRGDPKILEPGLRMIEERLHIPVIGVIPMEQIDLDDEDSLSDRLTHSHSGDASDREHMLDLAVIRLPHISNFTDFNVLERAEGVLLRYVERVDQLGTPDLILLPGTKSTMADLKWLRESGLEPQILRLNEERNIPVIGICGGYQMLGQWLRDPEGVEGEAGGVMRGIGLLDAETVFAEQKTRTQISGVLSSKTKMFENSDKLNDRNDRKSIEKQSGLGENSEGLEELKGQKSLKEQENAESDEAGERVTGYEIHMGITTRTGDSDSVVPVIALEDSRMDGLERADGLVFGTYLHGIFDNETLTRQLLTRLASRKGITLQNPQESVASYKERQYDKLADLVRKSMDMDRVYEILEESRKTTAGKNVLESKENTRIIENTEAMKVNERKATP